MDTSDSGNVEGMKGFIPRVKRLIMEPKVYALVVRTKGIAILHLGIHHSLDEAFAAAKRRAMEETKIKEESKLNLDFWMWEIIPAGVVMSKMLDRVTMTMPGVPDLSTGAHDEAPETPISASEYAKQVYDMKNNLMKRIIEEKDHEALKQALTILSPDEVKLVQSKLDDVK